MSNNKFLQGEAASDKLKFEVDNHKKKLGEI